MNYKKFIQSKTKTHINNSIKNIRLNKHLFDFQRPLTQKALIRGRSALFADCGLGKTIIQLDWANNITRHTNKPTLILTPLAVSGQTINEAAKFDINANGLGNGNIEVTNYEQLHNIDVDLYGGIVLDESSIIKNFNGKLKALIFDKFKAFEFKLACTATPSPNDVMELGNHSEFISTMSRLEVFSRYFVHDGGETSKWRLKGHAQNEFWQYVSTWADVVTKPSDLGFPDGDFKLPPLNIKEHVIDYYNSESLFPEAAVSATNFNQTLRLTKDKRIIKALELTDNKEPAIVWVKHNDESTELANSIDGAIEVTGSMDNEKKENLLLGFGKNDFRVLVTKPKIAQYGLNYQNCNNQVFCSLDFSFEGLYQSIRRSYRFGQKKTVNIHLITTSNMINVLQSIKRKEKQFFEMQQNIKKHAKF